MEAAMFHITPGNIQVYSPFGTYVVEQHEAGWLQRYIDDIPRPDLKLGKDHPLFENAHDDHRAN